MADEDVKFERLELAPLEDERDDSRERQLGLIEPERRQERGPEAAAPDEDGEMEMDAREDEEGEG